RAAPADLGLQHPDPLGLRGRGAPPVRGLPGRLRHPAAGRPAQRRRRLHARPAALTPRRGAMAAYVIVDVEPVDAERYREYPERASPSRQGYGGRYVVRGGRFEAPEGGWQPRRLVVLEFPSYEQAQQWYRSPEYQELVPRRQQHGRNGAFILVEGV